ncbi:MAG: flagellar export chaperone FliS [Desulfobacterales bacterium]|nr:MAG: flagellar export chaperone FliS [Desulfobacterales bacterium]
MIGYNGFNNGMQYNRPNQGAYAPKGAVTTNSYGGGNSYAQNQILTASPEQILIMLFDAAIRFNREAQAANDAGNTAKKLEKIGRVFNIISELSNTLDHNIGGEIAKELDALYQFHLQELGRARTDKSNKHLKFVEAFLVEWRETWLEVIDINRAEAAARARQNDSQYSQKLAVAG